MRAALALLGLAACHSSSSEKAPEPAAPTSLSVEGYGVHLVPMPGTSCAHLANNTLVFGPLATEPKPANILNVAVKKGKPPTKLAPVTEGSMTVYTDGGTDTTKVALGIDMTTYAGVLKDATVSPRTGAWTIIADGKEQAWTPGLRLDVKADGRFELVDPP